MEPPVLRNVRLSSRRALVSATALFAALALAPGGCEPNPNPDAPPGPAVPAPVDTGAPPVGEGSGNGGGLGGENSGENSGNNGTGNNGGGNVANPGKVGDFDLSKFTSVKDYQFGTGAGSNVTSIEDLKKDFKPYAIAGTTVINNEWQRYQEFNKTNHNFSANALDLTAVKSGKCYCDGGFSSGQIASQATYRPGKGETLVFQLRAKIPKGKGTWPAFWFYRAEAGSSSSDEIDVFEFWNGPKRNTHHWTGYDHAGNGGKVFVDEHKDIGDCDGKCGVWTAPFDFAEAYHTFTLVWSDTETRRYVDDKLLTHREWQWTDKSAPNLIINLALGSKDWNSPPDESTGWPAVFSLDSLRILKSS